MTEQEENEAICEKLLGWTRETARKAPYGAVTWRGSAEIPGTREQPEGFDESYLYTPSFDNGYGAWLILEALQANVSIAVPKLAHHLACYRLTPAIVRTLALEHLASASSTPVSA